MLTSCLNSDNELDNSEDIAYLEENAGKEGVTTTNSGLQYRVLTEGDGEAPVASSKVRVHYEGRFINGDVFESTHEGDKQPAEFPVNGLISGFTEGLLLMKEGAVYELVIPSQLAYGNTGQGAIYGGATIIFEIELLEIL